MSCASASILKANLFLTWTPEGRLSTFAGEIAGSHDVTHEETLNWKPGDPFYRGVFRTKELEARGQWGMTYYYDDGSITGTMYTSRLEAACAWCALQERF